jgi:DnaJ-class molecular chaperone
MADAEPQQCAPCRGTGRVISNLGGTANEVMCPWCEGSGRMIPGHNAQAARAKTEQPSAPPSGA